MGAWCVSADDATKDVVFVSRLGILSRTKFPTKKILVDIFTVTVAVTVGTKSTKLAFVVEEESRLHSANGKSQWMSSPWH